MAKYIKFEYGDNYESNLFNGDSQIEVVCNEEVGLERFKDAEIQDAENITVYEIQPGGMGGGADSPLLLMILSPILSLTLCVGVLTAKAFFEEIGKSLAHKLLSKFENLPGMGQITMIDKSWNKIELIVPDNLTTKDCETMCDALNEFTKKLPRDITSIYLTYDKDTKKIVVLSK